MKITINDYRNFQLEEVFNPVTLVSGSGEKIRIIMCDSGFELWYEQDSEHNTYCFKNGIVEKVESPRKA